MPFGPHFPTSSQAHREESISFLPLDFNPAPHPHTWLAQDFSNPLASASQVPRLQAGAITPSFSGSSQTCVCLALLQPGSLTEGWSHLTPEFPRDNMTVL